MRSNLFLVAVVLAVAGCPSDWRVQGPELPSWPPSHPPEPPADTVTDELVQVSQPLVDVLWIIDNSCSMDDEQRALVDNYAAFLDYFKGSGLDWQMGVVSTDINEQGRLRGAGGFTWLDEQTPNPEGVFAAMALLGTNGNGCEKGLATSFLGLEVNAANDGFLRDDAALHSIVISDEPDQSDGDPVTEDEYVDWYSGLKRSDDERSFSAIAAVDPRPDCSARPVNYHDVVAGIGGISWDIENPNWQQVLDQLGVQAAGLRREYFLSQRPVPDSLEVAVATPEGQLFAFVQENEGAMAYDYDPNRNSITFHEFIPGPLSTVRITYELLATGVLTIEGEGPLD